MLRSVFLKEESDGLMAKIKICCEDMRELLLSKFVKFFPFGELWAYGIGGITFRIHYCPFCGKKIELEAEE